MRRRWLAVLLTLVFLTGCGAPAATPPETISDGFKGIELPTPYVIPDITLTDTDGRPFAIRTDPERPVRVLFFGYTHCPDICPGVLADVAGALNRVPEEVRSEVEVIFVTTDPARDTPAAIRTYLDRFDPAFTGLTGSIDDITALADAVGVAMARQDELPDGGYEVDHTASLIGVDRQGGGAVVWTVGTPIGDLAHDLERMVTR